MSELKARQGIINGQQFELYFKAEADKVIAELEDKLKVQTSIAEEGWKEFRTYHTSYAEAVKELYEKNKELRHQKYKRCLAMARWCETQFAYYIASCDRYDSKYVNKKAGHFYRWKYRWMEIAEHYKESK